MHHSRFFSTSPFCALISILALSLLSGCGPGFQQAEVLPEESALEDDLPNEDLPPIPEPDPDAPIGPFPNPVTDPDFTKLSNGKDLTEISVSGSRLSLARGSGQTFTSSKQQQYEDLKRATQTDPDHDVRWVFIDLDAHRIIEKSLSADRKLFGASSSKIYVAAALMDWQNGDISSSQLQLMANMLVVSSNSAWTELQRQIGDGSSDKGRERIHNFTQRMGYEKTRGFQGYWGSLHGNELVPEETAETLYDLYTGAFPGADIVWKLMYTCRTGSSRGRKYIPSDIYVGGKTGTYHGPTENPETGEQYTVRVHNHVLIFHIDGVQYGLVILANSGSDESAALLAGGLIREHTSVK